MLRHPLKVMTSLFLLSQWYTLKDVKSGRVHLVLEWVPTASTAARLHQVSAALLDTKHHPNCYTFAPWDHGAKS